MTHIVIDDIYCKGCYLCMHYCNKQILEKSGKTNSKGYEIPYVVRPEKCTACRICEMICPEMAITVEGDEICEKK